ncbi:MAG: class I SAM-dependent methyltransferase [Anaerolineales bacterium]|nr:class I SAM-dependent methyltransferase [Anaerolineae bacterium]PWB54670.1 MAG: class I SAM-dependent methyltransferase [Anaerolineales bacterium]
MITAAAGKRLEGRMLENGCGVGMYLQHLASQVKSIVGLEYELERAKEAQAHSSQVINGACEHLPFPANAFDVILSHEVLEHVSDDQRSVSEMLRVLSPGGIIVLFVPNLGYPFETHGIYWHGRYHFGNIPLIHYLPVKLRKQLMPHVRVYSSSDLAKLFKGMPVRITDRKIIFGAYDNIINRFPTMGRFLRRLLQWLENTPLKVFGLSHLWIIEKI